MEAPEIERIDGGRPRRRARERGGGGAEEAGGNRGGAGAGVQGDVQGDPEVHRWGRGELLLTVPLFLLVVRVCGGCGGKGCGVLFGCRCC